MTQRNIQPPNNPLYFKGWGVGLLYVIYKHETKRSKLHRRHTKRNDISDTTTQTTHYETPNPLRKFFKFFKGCCLCGGDGVSFHVVWVVVSFLSLVSLCGFQTHIETQTTTHETNEI